MATEQWWRSWHNAPTDTKWLSVARRANVPPGIVAAIAWAMLDYASQNADRGSIEGFDTESYADWSGFEEESIVAVIQAMRDKGILTESYFTEWEKRQPKREDDSAERVRRYRERQGDNVTQGDAEKRTVTQCNAEKRTVTLEERRIEENIPTTSIDVVGSPASSAQTPAITETATQSQPVPVQAPTPAPDPAPTSQITKSSRTVANPTAQQLMIGAVADVCMIDLKLKSGAGRAGKAAAELLAAGYTATQVTAFKDWWYACDWRGQRGDTPTPARVVELIKQSLTPRPDIVRGNGNTRPERSSKHGSNPNHPQNGSATNGVVGSIDEYIADLPAEWR